MAEESCIFCKIAKGEIPSHTIYEDDEFRAFLDVSPISKGHVLVIPKAHHKNLFELPDDLARKAMVVSKKVAAHMSKKLAYDGLNLVQNNGIVATQSVFHFHIHLVPRYKEEEVEGKLRWNNKTATKEELSEVAALLNSKDEVEV
ncbi:HIT family protein [Lachnospiraceae bacterium ZAX-1]